MGKEEVCPHCDYPVQHDMFGVSLPNFTKKDETEKIMSKYQKIGENFESPNYNKNLITCIACGEQISKNALSCPHCGEPMVQSKTGSQLSSKDSKESLLGFVGATLLMIGAFLPAINIPIRGGISYLNNGRGDGMLIILIALIAFYYVYKKKKRSLLLSGGSALIVIAYGFVNVLQRIAKVQEGATSGIGKAMLGGVDVGSAFGVTAVGAILIIISSFMMKK